MRVDSRAVRIAAPSYLDYYAAQTGALGVTGQRRVQRATVLVAGAGGLGTVIAQVLATSGVGTLIVVDPQRVEWDNFNRSSFLRQRDVGRPKADVIASSLDGRAHLTVIPIVSRIEAISEDSVINQADLLVATPNCVRARIAVATLAVRWQVPQVAAALTDAREGSRGVVSCWTPQRPGLACPACLLAPRARLRRAESILAPVAAAVGAIAAYSVMRMVTVGCRVLDDTGNVISIDLDRHSTESLRVLKRDDCVACGLANHGR